MSGPKGARGRRFEGALDPVAAAVNASVDFDRRLLPHDVAGSIVVGKQADLVVINGNPAAQIGDVRKVQMVFKQGVGYDPAAIIESVKGKVGLW